MINAPGTYSLEAALHISNISKYLRSKISSLLI